MSLFYKSNTLNALSINDVANQIEATVNKHCVLPTGAATAITLWCIATYCIDAFPIFPRLVVYSPERRCGKSTCLDLVAAYSHKSELISNATPAVIFRYIEQSKPTLILDEADTYVQNANSELIGILNSGHKKSSANTLRCVGKDNLPKRFSTWAPMAFGSIGELQSTIMDRSICIPVSRKLPTESISSVPVDLSEITDPIRSFLQDWCMSAFNNLKTCTSTPTYIGNDRAVDNWTPLLTIAEAISDEWKSKCLISYNKLTAPSEPELPTQLLYDIRELFDIQATNGYPEKLFSTDMVNKLNSDPDKQWSNSNNGGKLTASKLAKLLSPYSVHPKQIRIDHLSKKGYEVEMFKNAFDRYLD